MILLGLEVLVGTYVGTRVKAYFDDKKQNENIEIEVIENKDESLPILSSDEVEVNRYLKTATIAIGLAGARFVYAPLVIPALIYASYAAIPILKESSGSISEKKIKNDVLNSLVVISCFATGYYLTVSLVAGYYHLANKMVMKTKNRSEKMLIDIFGQQAATAWILVDDVEMEIALESIKIDDVVVISMGQSVPIDGEIIDGMAMIDEHVLTGESMPVEKNQGAEVFASTLMLSGKIWVKVKQTGSDTNISKISCLLTDTMDFKSNAQTQAETIANNVATPLLVSSVLFAPFIGIPAATTILYSSPGNTIKLLGSLQTLNKLAQAYQEGLLVKDGRALENLLEVDTIFFDKTGTLTTAEPKVGKILPLDEFDGLPT